MAEFPLRPQLSYAESLGIPPPAVMQNLPPPVQPEIAGTARQITPDEAAMAVQDLLNSLEYAQAPEQPKTKLAQRIIGSIGDALMAMASVKAGGAPPQIGAFGASQLKRQQDFQSQSAAAGESNKDLRNNVRLMALRNQFARMQKAEAGQDADPFAGTLERVAVSDISAKNNPQIAELRKSGVPDGTVVIQSIERPKTGKVITGPIIGYAPVAQSIEDIDKQGLTGLNRNTLRQTPLGAFPPPKEGFVERVAGLRSLQEGIAPLMDIFDVASESVGGSEGTLNKIQNYLQALAAPTGIGPIVAPTELRKYYRSVRSVLFPYVKSISGAAFPEQELRRYESQFPIPGVDDPEGAAYAWQVLIDQIVRDMRALYGTAGRPLPADAEGASPATSGKKGEAKVILDNAFGGGE